VAEVAETYRAGTRAALTDNYSLFGLFLVFLVENGKDTSSSPVGGERENPGGRR
jgi:hypothetical protein